MTNVRIVNQSNNPLPIYKTKGSSGMDIMAFLESPLTLQPLERTLVPTGLYIELQEGYEVQLRPRSGMAIKHGISLVNAVGTIDSDYRGEIKIPAINLSNEAYTIHSGDRIAQMIVAEYERVEWIEVDVLDETERGSGGFGSTGFSG